MRQTSDKELLLTILREELPAEEVDEFSSFGNPPSWDSVAHMKILFRLEAALSMRVGAANVSRLLSVPAILEFLGTQKRESRPC